MAHDVFIAHSSRDSEAAAIAEAALLASGLSCYLYTQNRPGTPAWTAEVAQAISACHAVLFLVSDHSVASPHVLKEIHFASEKSRTVVPVMLRAGIVLPDWAGLALAGMHYAIAVPSLATVLPSVVDALLHAVDRDAHPDSYQAEEDVRRRANYRLAADVGQDDLELFVGEDPSGVARIEAGRYVVTAKPGKYAVHLLHGAPLLSEYVLTACITKLEGPEEAWFGLRFGEGHSQNYYKFWLSGNRGIRVERRWKGKHSDLARLNDARQVTAGNADNTLKVICAGDSLHLFVNGLHAVSRHNIERLAGRPGFAVGPGVRAAFSDLRVDGVSLPALFDSAITQWRNLEMREAKRCLRYIAQYAPNLKHPDHPSEVAHLLLEVQPDRRESTLIVVGSTMLGHLNDGPVAIRLCDEVNRRGGGEEFRWASVVTDQAVLAEPRYLSCPLIAIGGPDTNKLTARLTEQLPADPRGAGGVHVHHDLDHHDRRVTLWGAGAAETVQAVDLFISTGLLDRFIAAIWQQAGSPTVCTGPMLGAAALPEIAQATPPPRPSPPNSIPPESTGELSGGAQLRPGSKATETDDGQRPAPQAEKPGRILWHTLRRRRRPIVLTGLAMIVIALSLNWLGFRPWRDSMPRTGSAPRGSGAALAPRQGEPAWPMLLFGPERRGQHPYPTTAKGLLQWEFKTSGKLSASPAIGGDGTIYVQGSDRYLYALSPQGELKWKFMTGRGVAGNISGFSSPAIATDGTIYVGSSDTFVYAVRPDGRLKWKVKTGWCVPSSPAIGPDGTVYTGSDDHSLYAITPNGHVKWQWKGASGGVYSPALAADGTAYVGSSDDCIYAIGPTGTLKWSYKTGGPVWSCPTIGADGTIYVGSDDTHLYAFSPEGKLKWKFEANGAVGRPAAVGPDGTIYVGATSQGLYALDPGGSVKWSFRQPRGAPDAPVVGADGTVYVGFAWGHNRLYALDREGQPKWEFAVSADWSTPAVGRDGTLYLTAQQGSVYAIR